MYDLQSYTREYPDGSIYIDYVSRSTAREGLVSRIKDYKSLMATAMFLESVNHQYPDVTPTIHILFMIDGQEDRRNDTSSFSLKVSASLLDSYKADFIFYDPHSPDVLAALFKNNRVHIKDSTSFLEKIYEKLDSDITNNMVLMAPDSGAFKRYHKITEKSYILSRVPLLSASKSRINGQITTVYSGESVEGKEAFIVDDICMGGRTFKNLARILKEQGAASVKLIVTVMAYERMSDYSLLEELDGIVTTDFKHEKIFFGDDEECATKAHKSKFAMLNFKQL